MPTFVESGIQFDFNSNVTVRKFDDESREWPAVDFIIHESNKWTWLEIKNWEPIDLPAKYRGGQRRKFLSKMKSTIYFNETLRGKFLGASAYLSHFNQFIQKPLEYVVLIESPKLTSAILLHVTKRLQQLVLLKNLQYVTVIAVDLLEWNLRYPEHPAKVL